MRLPFGTSVIGAPGGWQAAFTLSAVRADNELRRVVHVPSSGSDRLPKTVWTEGTRIFLSPRPLQLAGGGVPGARFGRAGVPIALISTGELQAVFARVRLCCPVRLPVDQATLSAADIHIPATTWEALAPTMRDEEPLHVVAACVDVAAFTYRQAQSRRNDVCAVQ